MSYGLNTFELDAICAVPIHFTYSGWSKLNLDIPGSLPKLVIPSWLNEQDMTLKPSLHALKQIDLKFTITVTVQNTPERAAAWDQQVAGWEEQLETWNEGCDVNMNVHTIV